MSALDVPIFRERSRVQDASKRQDKNGEPCLRSSPKGALARNTAYKAYLYLEFSTHLTPGLTLSPNTDRMVLTLQFQTAVIKEGLRYSSPAASRTPRLVPSGGVTLPDGRHVPAGTRIGMAIYHIHYNEAMVAFSRGSRSCLGINLAYMEMYMAIGYLVRRFDFKLAGTTAEDMMWDDMVPSPV
jgi:cytochrome P450